MELYLGLLIPFIGTTIGSAMVFLMKKEINRKVEKFLLGFNCTEFSALRDIKRVFNNRLMDLFESKGIL